jgi:hypothetical protein
MRRKRRKLIRAWRLKRLLKAYRVKLTCGHYASPGHPWSNTMVVLSNGKIICSECYG